MLPEVPSPSPAVNAAHAPEVERHRWNQALLDPEWRRTRFNAQPNSLLTETVAHLAPGAALDVHMGEGRNALHLARLGWRVTGIDVAEQALAYAQQRAQQENLLLTTVAHDARTYPWGHHAWDLIVLCYADEDAHVEQVQDALTPGGLVVFENLHADINLSRPDPTGRRLGFTTTELRNRYAAAGFRILRYEEPLAVADFSLETRRLVRLVARGP